MNMKRFKKIFINLLAVLMIGVACFGLMACEDIRTIEVTVSVYNADDSTMVEKVIKVDMYRHLAPNTVDKITEYVNEGYYNDAMFYVNGNHSSQIMMGEFKYNNGVIEKTAVKPTIEGEFEKGGTVGSNLTSVEGAIGLWRNWFKKDGSYAVSDDARESGSSTWYMPTSSISGYNGWFCVFALVDLENETNSETWELIKSACTKADNYEEYTVYYTGEYDSSKYFDENHGLTYNCVLSEDFDEDLEIFEAEKDQYTCYNKYTLKVPVYKTNNAVRGVGAKVVSMKMA